MANRDPENDPSLPLPVREYFRRARNYLGHTSRFLSALCVVSAWALLSAILLWVDPDSPTVRWPELVVFLSLPPLWWGIWRLHVIKQDVDLRYEVVRAYFRRLEQFLE